MRVRVPPAGPMHPHMCDGNGSSCDMTATCVNFWWYDGDGTTPLVPPSSLNYEFLCEHHHEREIMRDQRIRKGNLTSSNGPVLRSIYLPVVQPYVDDERSTYVEIMCHALSMIQS